VKLGRWLRRRALAVVLPMLLAAPAHALTIHFSAADLPDVTAGEDLWHYEYKVQGALDASFGFTLLYPPALYGPLGAIEISPDASWFLTALSPDPLGDGFVSALALAPIDAAQPSVLLVDVVWKGQGAPGTQAFQVFNDVFAVVSEGRTQPDQPLSAPEPGTFLLVATGFALLTRCARRHR